MDPFTNTCTKYNQIIKYNVEESLFLITSTELNTFVKESWEYNRLPDQDKIQEIKKYS